MKFTKSYLFVFILSGFLMAGFTSPDLNSVEKKFTKRHLQELRERTVNEKIFRHRLRSSKKKVIRKAVAEVTGVELAKKVKILILKNIGSSGKQSLNVELLETAGLEQFVIVLPPGVWDGPPTEGETTISGDAVNSFCLAEVDTVGNAWQCTDEEVKITSGMIRGKWGRQ